MLDVGSVPPPSCHPGILSRKKLVSWVSWIPRNISQNVKIEEHSVKITKNFVAFQVKYEDKEDISSKN